MRCCHAITALMYMMAVSGTGQAAEQPDPLDTDDRINYSLGYQVGKDFKRQGVELNEAAVTRGVQDAQSGASVQPLLSREVMDSLLGHLKGDILDTKKSDAIKRYEQRKARAERKRTEGRAFLAENGKRPGVKTLSSGLQYRVIKPGEGKSPGPHDRVSVNYRSTLINGHEFDNSERRKGPASFRVDGVVAGWTEALQLMRKGAVWEIFLPPDLGYGERGPLADETTIFKIELLEVADNSEAQKKQPEPRQIP